MRGAGYPPVAAVRTEANIAARKTKFAKSPRDACAVAIVRPVLEQLLALYCCQHNKLYRALVLLYGEPLCRSRINLQQARHGEHGINTYPLARGTVRMTLCKILIFVVIVHILNLGRETWTT